ncbi:MAG TPA: NAD-dependent epimerase/dehydratase family protein, partial [Patescibacteria group bacterium]|nr:NAD-dependent epimerase/dehydratase family protein [Patescibacteria group bacterium]
MTIFVTGCAGFIGSNFCKTFLKRFKKATVVGIDNFATGRREEVQKGIVFYEGSILDELLLETIFTKHKPQYVFHFAALPRVSFSVAEPVVSAETNIMGTIKILNAARRHKAKRVIYSSSSSVYGGAKILPTKEKDNLANPRSPYALQKYTGEPMCKFFSEIYGLDTTCLRYFNVFGPGQYGDSPYATVTSAWLEALYFKGPSFEGRPFMEGDGFQAKDYTYIDNVVEANLLAMKCKRTLQGEVFNIGSSQQI